MLFKKVKIKIFCKNQLRSARGSIIDCIVFPPSQLGTFPTSLVGTFPVWKMGMQLYISAATQHINTILTAVLVLLLPLYHFVCVYVCFKLLELRFQIYIGAIMPANKNMKKLLKASLRLSLTLQHTACCFVCVC